MSEQQQTETTTAEETAAEITFSEAQHAKLNEIAARERRDGEAKGRKAAEMAFLQSFGVQSLDDLKGLISKAQQRPEEKPDDSKVSDLLAKRDTEWKAKLDEANRRLEEAAKANEAIRADFRSKEKRAALVDAAVKAKAVDPEIVARLLDDQLDYDDQGRLVVKGEAGYRLNAKGDPITPAELVAQYLAERPFLAASSGTTGSGGHTSGRPTAGNFTAAQIAMMTPDEINANWDAISKQMASGAIR